FPSFPFGRKNAAAKSPTHKTQSGNQLGKFAGNGTSAKHALGTPNASVESGKEKRRTPGTAGLPPRPRSSDELPGSATQGPTPVGLGFFFASRQNSALLALPAYVVS